MKGWTTQLNIDYHAIVLDFIHRSACFNISLIFEESPQFEVPPHFTVPRVGFDCNLDPSQPKQGLASWPAIFTLPQSEPPQEHWPNVISLIMGNTEHLSRYKEPLYCFDKRILATYFCSMVEPRITIKQWYQRRVREVKRKFAVQFNLKCLRSNLGQHKKKLPKNFLRNSTVIWELFISPKPLN
eukprot:TRINITY_DN8935_c0_g1_i4.p1 TRINITY_DN8935_c0_g1~~TRINITY_DN8935_c0_g1_i4.p1  ORF type:complete len:184 (-),score=37.02 TRINITY_DN8935_c0_g1_i4:191-742(-)